MTQQEQAPEGRRPAAENSFRRGFLDGVPIGLGYFSVSIAFGILCAVNGMDIRATVLISMTNLTSAGQLAGAGVIFGGGTLLEMALTQLVINLRYCLMSCSLSQKLGADMPFFHRFFMSYGVTDEIFGVSVCRPGFLSPFYSYGLICVAVPGWTLGTLLGAVSGELLPARLLSALNVALYGMFLAVVIPPAKTSRILTGVILASMALSLVFAHVPLLAGLSSGFKIILLTILIAGAAAILFPVKEENEHES